MIETPRILIACEYSGTVRDAFARRGWYAVSCDLLPTESEGLHHQGDVLEILDDGWDMVVAHPPCTYLANSGAGWFGKGTDREEKRENAIRFFMEFLQCRSPFVAVENPTMSRYAREKGIGPPSFSIQPWQFGHPESKRTCFWTKRLPRLRAAKDVRREFLILPKRLAQRLHYLPPSPDRWKLRSKTYKGVAQAMADQWGPWVERRFMEYRDR